MSDDLPDGFVLDGQDASLPPGFQLDTVPHRQSGGGVMENLSAGSMGANSALAQVLGAPVDLVNSALKWAGLPSSPRPIGGSESNRKWMDAAVKAIKEYSGLGNPDIKATYSDINQLPERLRPSARAGEVAGSTLGLVGPMAGLAGAGKTATEIAAMSRANPAAGAVSNVLRGIRGEAASNPTGFIRSQLPASVAQGAGAFGAETVFPGDPNMQIAGQLTGGLLGAGLTVGGKAAAGGTKGLLDAAREPFTSQTDEGLKSIAGRALAPILQKAGENPQDIIRRLQLPPLVSGQTAGEAAQSRGIKGVSDYLQRDNADLANAVAGGSKTYQQNLQTGLQQSFQPGRQANLTSGSKDALRAARAEETRLWNIPDTSEHLTAQGTDAAYKVATGDLLPGESVLPKPVTDAIEGLGPVTDLGTLQKLRTRVLAMARDAAQSGKDPDLTRRLNILGEGILSDLSTSAQPETQAARDYSRQLNQLFAPTKKTAPFGRLIAAGENPTDAIAKVLNGPAPVADFGRMATIAQKGGPDAVAGLRSAALQHVLDNSQARGTLSYAKANTMLNQPLAPDGPSLLQSMRTTGVVNASQHAQIQQFLDTGLAQEVSKISGVDVKAFGTEPGMWAKAASRVFGAKLAERIAGGGGAGPSLQVAALGAGLAEKTFAKLPLDRAKQFMAQALASENPADLIDILERSSAASGITTGKNGNQATQALVLLRAAIPRTQSQTQWSNQPGQNGITPLELTINRPNRQY